MRVSRGFSSSEDEHGANKIEDEKEIDNMDLVYATSRDAAAYEHPILHNGLGSKTRT